MPRPTAAQLAYGSITVIFSTLAMLLLSQTSSGVGIAIIAVAALALGLLVAMTVPMPKPRLVAVGKPATETARTTEAPVPASVAMVASEPVHERAAS
jgi:archaellum biogenesis protein FlaJ (TadC family)